MNKSQLVFCLLIVITLSSCVSKKKIIYLQGQQNQSSNQVNYEPLIQNDDLLSITISSVEPELAAPFNLDQLQSGSGSSSGSNVNKTTYLVDSAGEIDFPVLGKMKVAGLTKALLKQQIKERLALYLTEPIINIRIVNFKISVLGEVNKPGSYTLTGDRITLLEVIANAGDLTLFGKRDNILIVRDYLGTKTYNRVDITKADFVNSPFYYLDQNDVVYVEPRKARIDGTAIGGNITAIMSIASFLITTTLLLTR